MADPSSEPELFLLSRICAATPDHEVANSISTRVRQSWEYLSPEGRLHPVFRRLAQLARTRVAIVKVVLSRVVGCRMLQVYVYSSAYQVFKCVSVQMYIYSSV